MSSSFFFFFFRLLNELFTFLFLATLGLRCCTRAFSSCGEQELLSGCGVLASRLWWLLFSGLQSSGSVVVMHGLSCSVARGLFLGQGLNCKATLNHWASREVPGVFLTTRQNESQSCT